ncbi:thermonuclease family protein [Bradyrhizobium sp. AUGA SZCCT0042]|uniref:thermonuclease family protein n=1 Tax=Bradyrhizobium sp. AUGA SZCCT0042 TaxID=2807651 RepID=UPI001BA95575|nr:hypothetical protein [Bradyrhizobium sp. AUGA SZCCT0042]MBR1296629.1 hypothetical protein [Bradyrhizobium sp. AUGA SZCCT0042]
MAFKRWPDEPKESATRTGIRQTGVVLIFGAVVAALIAFFAATAFLDWKAKPAIQLPVAQQNAAATVRSEFETSGPIEVIDGDTVRNAGFTYRLVGFDTAERGDRARCDFERQKAEAATRRLQGLVADKTAGLERVACACPPGQEGSKQCNCGRRCGTLSVNGRDVVVLIAEGLAHRYVCSGTSCPKRQPWCDGR